MRSGKEAVALYAATSSNAMAAFHPWAKFATSASQRLGGLSARMLLSNTLSHVWRFWVAPENGHGAVSVMSGVVDSGQESGHGRIDANDPQADAEV